MGKRKVQVIRRIREVYEFEIDEDSTVWDSAQTIKTAINKDTLEKAKDLNLKLLKRTNMDITYPIGDNLLAVQTHKENMLILDEFIRIWGHYPSEDFSSTIHELTRTIHEECTTDDYASYLPEGHLEKYFTNEGTEEEPDWVEIEELWSERYDVEYEAINKWILDMDNEELLHWMKRLVEFLGY